MFKCIGNVDKSKNKTSEPFLSRKDLQKSLILNNEISRSPLQHNSELRQNRHVNGLFTSKIEHAAVNFCLFLMIDSSRSLVFILSIFRAYVRA